MNMMQRLALILMGGVLAGTVGCSKTGPGTPRASTAKGAAASGVKAVKEEKKVIVSTPSGISGRVASVNLGAQFVVVSLQGGALPVQDQRLAVYRGALKVGEIKVSKEQNGQNFVADIVAGEARAGDEVRIEGP
jgi:hypothetical protein